MRENRKMNGFYRSKEKERERKDEKNKKRGKKLERAEKEKNSKDGIGFRGFPESLLVLTSVRLPRHVARIRPLYAPLRYHVDAETHESHQPRILKKSKDIFL